MKTRLRLLASSSLALATTSLLATTRYVDLNNPSPASPYTNWTAAATNIQNAIDSASDGDTVLVTNGVYATGGSVVNGALTNRIALTQAIQVISVNGAAFTFIQGNPVIGDSAVRCAYLTNGASLTGFSLIQGATRAVTDGTSDGIGGGIWCESTGASVTNCIISGNEAGYGAGGVYQGSLYGCVIKSNTAVQGRGFGGAAWKSKLVNSSLFGNLAFGAAAEVCTSYNCVICANGGEGLSGGIAVNCTIANNSIGGAVNLSSLANCVVYYNGGGNGSANMFKCCLDHPAYSGSDNITNAPLFLDPSALNYRLQSNSPCINSGNNSSISYMTDLDSNPRIVGGTVDIGAYEYQSPVTQISYAWLQRYGLPINSSTDSADGDGDGHNNYREWRAGTDPTNAASVLRMLSPANGVPGLVVNWSSVSGKSYWIERATNPASFSTLATNLAGQTNLTSFNDTSATNSGPYFYRVGVQ